MNRQKDIVWRERRRVEDIIESFSRHRELALRSNDKGDVNRDDYREAERSLYATNVTLRRYAILPTFEPLPGRLPGIFYHPIPAKTNIHPAEWNAVQDLLSLAIAGSLSRLRKCEQCGKWMYTSNPDGSRKQRFCSGGKCLKAWRSENEEYKAAQRAAVKANRTTKKYLSEKKFKKRRRNKKRR